MEYNSHLPISYKRFLILRQVCHSPGLICEASKFDRVWGIGMEATDPRVSNPQEWKGSNELGKRLMRIRDILKGNALLTDITSNSNIELFFSWFTVN